MGGFFGPAGGTSGSGPPLSRLGTRLSFASPAGAAVAAAPAGFNTSTGRLLVTLAAGAATWISLTAGVDGQLLQVRNLDANNTLTLPASAFGGFGDLVLPPAGAALLYYDTTAASWERTSP